MFYYTICIYVTGYSTITSPHLLQDVCRASMAQEGCRLLGLAGHLLALGMDASNYKDWGVPSVGVPILRPYNLGSIFGQRPILGNSHIRSRRRLRVEPPGCQLGAAPIADSRHRARSLDTEPRRAWAGAVLNRPHGKDNDP